MNNDEALLIMIHCEQFTGYAIGVLEEVFLSSAKLAGYADDKIFWSYKSVTDEKSGHVISCDYRNERSYQSLIDLVKQKKIKKVIAFDMPYPAPVIAALRHAGVEKIISYWGASMSSINTGLKLTLKQLEWYLRRHKPDHFIFESEAMRYTATHGRGVPAEKTSIITLGVDTEFYFPLYGKDSYAHNVLNIPLDRKIVFYSGHMEERKGVRVIIQAAIELLDKHNSTNLHFVICGNKNNEAVVYQNLLQGKAAETHVTFAGYRTDIAALMRSSFMGVIASTGWDSFTMSSVEMMASGLPLVVSSLQGLAETIEPGVNGYHIVPGGYQELAEKIQLLNHNEDLALQFSQASRVRAETLFSKQEQVRKIAETLTTI